MLSINERIEHLIFMCLTKNFTLLIVLIVLVSGCSTLKSNTSTERSEIIIWAKSVVAFKKNYKKETDEFSLIVNKLGYTLPTDDDFLRIKTIHNNITSMYNELSMMDPPTKASEVHKKYIKQYAQASKAILYYQMCVSQNDISYYEKYASAAKEGDLVGDDADESMLELLYQYSITCEEIDFCE